MRIGESEVSKAYLGPTLLYSKSPLIASYKCYDKTNEDSDRAVLTGNGYDLSEDINDDKGRDNRR